MPIFALKNNCGWNDKPNFVSEELPEMELKTVEDVMKLNSIMINRFLKNEVDLKYWAGINNLLNLQIRGIELTSIEKRIDDIEITLPKEFGIN